MNCEVVDQELVMMYLKFRPIWSGNGGNKAEWTEKEKEKEMGMEMVWGLWRRWDKRL